MKGERSNDSTDIYEISKSFPFYVLENINFNVLKSQRY